MRHGSGQDLQSYSYSAGNASRLRSLHPTRQILHTPSRRSWRRAAFADDRREHGTTNRYEYSH